MMRFVADAAGRRPARPPCAPGASRRCGPSGVVLQGGGKTASCSPGGGKWPVTRLLVGLHCTCAMCCHCRPGAAAAVGPSPSWCENPCCGIGTAAAGCREGHGATAGGRCAGDGRVGRARRDRQKHVGEADDRGRARVLHRGQRDRAGGVVLRAGGRRRPHRQAGARPASLPPSTASSAAVSTVYLRCWLSVCS